MTRKDFVLIAETIKGLTFLSENDRAWVASNFADKLATTNAAFKRATFIEATGTRKVGRDYLEEERADAFFAKAVNGGDL